MAESSIRVTPPSEACEGTKNASVFSRVKQRIRCVQRDIEAVMHHDPAARSKLEVIFTYPGVHALWIHRLAHSMWERDMKLGARMVSHANRFVTGVEIHPGATIGQGVFIDHGMGVVIGETAAVGDGCLLYKGVVLGGTSFERTIRHPQLGKNVVVGSNACILGNIRVGDGARIGSGSVVVREVPEDATVVGVPGRIVPKKGDSRANFEATLDHASLPDPVSEILRSLKDENEWLRARVRRLEQVMNVKVEQDAVAGEDNEMESRVRDFPPQHGG